MRQIWCTKGWADELRGSLAPDALLAKKIILLRFYCMFLESVKYRNEVGQEVSTFQPNLNLDDDRLTKGGGTSQQSIQLGCCPGALC